jgi:hypothetical protein
MINEPTLMKLSAYGLHLQSLTMTININGKIIQLNQMREWINDKLGSYFAEMWDQENRLDVQDEQIQMEDDYYDDDNYEQFTHIHRLFQRCFSDFYEILKNNEEAIADYSRDELWDEWPGQWQDFMDHLQKGQYRHLEATEDF